MKDEFLRKKGHRDANEASRELAEKYEKAEKEAADRERLLRRWRKSKDHS